MRTLSAVLTFALLSFGLTTTAYSQDEAILRCADFTDRAARTLCLEAVLAEAVAKKQGTQQAPQPAVTTGNSPPPAPAKASSPVASASTPVAPVAKEEPKTKNFELFGLLKRKPASEPPAAVETMQAKITELKFYKPDTLTITLDNNQVWRQLYAKPLTLRVDDAIKIYQTSWGKQFRLEAERLKGFIEVERVR
jgi:hypothetical protein